jgi:acetyl coenzyme A synthetase (ADP forming)-like protein
VSPAVRPQPPVLPRDHVLDDGTVVRLREVTPDDADRLLAMWARTSPESRRARFMGPFTLDRTNVARFVDLDPAVQFAVAATRGQGGAERMLGIARYERLPDRPERAEFAALVEDAAQGRGLGTALVRDVALRAAADGVTHLVGDMLVSNTRMLNLVRELGLEWSGGAEGGVARRDLDLGETAAFLAAMDEDERRAAVAAVSRFLRPERVAVVGASRDRRAIGGLVFDNAVRGAFHGAVYPVNPNATAVQGVAAYPSLSACPEVPDLVVVCVPAPLVTGVVDEAGRLGVRAVCVISAGFAEVEGGAARQDELLAVAGAHGLRLVGPNCMGLMNGAADVRMNTTFSTIFPRPGRVAMSSQSGALGLAVLDHVERRGLGIATFVSVGNKADVSGNDLLQYWEQDPDTDVVLMYLESFGNPRRFARIARRVSLAKPIVAVKAGRTGAGERAAASHTAAVSSGDTAVQALFAQTGVIRTDTLAELFDVASLLAAQPIPRGGRVAVLTNAGGPGILAADALESNGLEVPALSERTRAALREFLPPEAGIANPVDMIASASPEAYRRAMAALGAADEIDAVLVIYIPTGTSDPDAVAAAIAAARTGVPAEKPVLGVFLSAGDLPPALAAARIPAYAFPEDAARALGRVAAYGRWRRRPLGTVVRPEGVDVDPARAVVTGILADAPDGRWCTTAEASEVLRAYGVPTAHAAYVTTPEEAAACQRDWGVPVAVKVATALHKTDVGGLALDLRTASAAAEAVTRIRTDLARHGVAEHGERLLVQEMVTDGIEMVVGVTHDPSFGPLVVTGMGGTLVELLRDVAVRITPITDVDVAEMLDSLRMAPLLRGHRGAPPADVPALTDLLHRVGAMVEDLPEVAELDLNPVFVRPEGRGVVAVDVRLRIARPGGRPPR